MPHIIVLKTTLVVFLIGERLNSRYNPSYHNPNFGLATKAKGLQGPRGSPGVTSHTPGSVGKCEGMNLQTPKATPTLGDGIPVDSKNFREQFQGSKLNVFWRSLYH